MFRALTRNPSTSTTPVWSAVTLLMGAYFQDLVRGFAQVARLASATEYFAQLLKEHDLPGLPEELLPPAHGVQVADVAQDECEDQVDEHKAAHECDQEQEEGGVEETRQVSVLLVLFVEGIEIELAQHHEKRAEEEPDTVAEREGCVGLRRNKKSGIVDRGTRNESHP